MKAILVVISIMILGLYSCGDESTNPTPTPTEETKKYTLEEILTDSNWVEITDTLHYPLSVLNGYTLLNEKWDIHTILKINNFEELNKINESLDTNSFWYSKSKLNYNIDFNKFTLIGFKTKVSIRYNIKKIIFRNDKIKQYQYFTIDSYPLNAVDIEYDYNFILIPKIFENYNLVGEYLHIREYK